MALRKIVEQGDECLTKICRPVEKFDRRLHDLLDDMAETLADANGAGLAAPQVGILRRMIAVQRFDKPGEPFEIYLNPEIVEYSAETAPGREGCLSIPGCYGEVTRAQQIVLRYRDEQFAERTERIGGFTAVIFQHEVDHLDGILYTDRMDGTPLQRE